MAKLKKKTVKKKKPFFAKFELFKKLILANPGMTPTEAVIKAGYRCKDRKVASIIGAQNFAKLSIELPDLMDRMGLTDEKATEKMTKLLDAQKLHLCDIHIKKENGKYVVNQNSNDFMEVDDNPVQLKALELTLKLKGKLKDKSEIKVNGNITHNHFIAEAIRKSEGISDEK